MWLQYIISFSLLLTCISVDHNNFKTCKESTFCTRCRNVVPGNSQFAVVPGTLNIHSDNIAIDLINKENNHIFVLKLEAIENNIFRVQIDEKSPLKPRYRVQDSLKESPKTVSLTADEKHDGELTIKSGTNKAIIYSTPFRIDFYHNEILSISLNARGLMHFEHLRKKLQPSSQIENEEGNENDENKEGNENDENVVQQQEHEQENIDNEPEGSWDESFKSHLDSKPNGPEAISLDFSFPQAEILYGIPEHADSFALKPTTGTDPYRLYNLDVFEYEVDSKMAIYGSVPVLYGHGPTISAGIFWQNAAETWVDIYNPKFKNNVVQSIVNSGTNKDESLNAHFMSESGIIDAFILLGPTPLDTYKQYTDLTGTTQLPQMYTLAYHQCRWNYNNEKDVQDVQTNFDVHDIPMDTMWLDIEYTDSKKYFTWNAIAFPNSLEMIAKLKSNGRHLIIIVDPHIKRDSNYFVHNECTNKGYYVKNKDGNVYEGWCWPGAASYPDFFNPVVRKYFADQYLIENFKGTTEDVMIWNDMNEPSVFNGPEITMLKDNIHYGEWEHRDVHNLYAHMHLMSTFDGLSRRDPNQRPFILSRGHFSGSQRYAAIWTGDNKADWSHLAASIKMCLSEAVAGFSFCGADIGGFFGNPDSELFERWYQAGAFQPFYRSHAHIDTKRREPWLYPSDTKMIIRDAIRLRYSYLPLWYTMFYEHEKYGYPIMRPLLAHYPKDINGYAIDNQHLLQDKLLVRPIVDQGATQVQVYFPIKENGEGDIWYSIYDYQPYSQTEYVTFTAYRDQIPVFQRGGTIIPKKERIRRASTLMIDDPFTLVVCLDRLKRANGTLFIDDEKSYKYRQSEFLYIEFDFANNTLRNDVSGDLRFPTKTWLERVIIAGLERTPKSAQLKVAHKTYNLEIIPYEYDIVIRKPGINMKEQFTITLDY